MLHIIGHIAASLFNQWIRESQSRRWTHELKPHEVMWRRVQDMGNMDFKSKDEVVATLGTPSSVKKLKDGTQRLTWKGRRDKVVIHFDILDRYDRKTESYA